MHALQALRPGVLAMAVLLSWPSPGTAGPPATQAAPVAPRYDIKNIGRMKGVAEVRAQDINDQGMVVGTTFGWGHPQRGFLFSSSGMRELSPLPGGRVSEAMALNNLGVVAGLAENAASDWKPVLFRDGQPVDFLGVLVHSGEALAINDAGMVAGTADGRAFLHDGSTLRMIDIPGEKALIPSAVNRAGAVLLRDNETNHAYVYRDGQLSALPLLGDPLYFAAYDMNDAGQITGSANVNGRTQAFIYSDGAYQLLDTPAGAYDARGWRITNQGWVVGYLGSDSDSAFLYRDGVMHDLRSLLLPYGASHWQRLTAWGINEQGQIVGQGRYTGDHGTFFRSFIATPVPEPGSWGLMLAGLGVVAVAARRGARRYPV